MSDGRRCEWDQEDEGSDTWDTACKHLFTMLDGTPFESSMKYCCFCGGELVEVSWAPPENDDDE